MHTYFQKSFRRILAMVLCAAMLLPCAVMPVSAEEAGQIDLNVTQSADVQAESVPEETGSATEATEDIDGTQWVLPDCDCGSSADQIGSHGDSCARKAFLKTFADEATAEQIYDKWDALPGDCQAFILEYLSWNYAHKEKLDTLNALISGSGSGTEEPEQTGSASATAQDGTSVRLTGVPAGSGICVEAVTDETALAAIEGAVAEREDSSEQLFLWDISLRNAEGQEIQPDGTVRVELEIPGVTLHKYAQVFVVHVDDNGEASCVEAEVTENGGVAFTTEGFSVFAGFTVDFEYNGEEFSINGYETILLSELFDALRMPLKVAEVANVEFSDPTLVSVAEQPDGDWLLTSLQAFQTQEKLTVTMDDGTVYEIKVTDAITTKANFYIAYMAGGVINYIDGNAVSGGNAEVQLFLDSDGHPSSNDSNVSSNNFINQPLVVDGRGVGGCMEIILQKATGAGNNLVWDLTQFRIINGAKVVIRLGASFTGSETITIRSRKPYSNYDARPLFSIEDGSLYFNLSAENAGLCSGTGMQVSSTSSAKEIVFDGGDLSPNWKVPLIYMHRGIDEANRENLVMEGVTFRNAKHRAILVQTNNLTLLRLDDCSFEDTVREVQYGGGAIYIDVNTDAGSDGSTNRVDVHRFELNGCTFDGNIATDGYGGAIAQFGNVYSGLINGCTFSDCVSKTQGGGAISIAGGTGAMTFQNTTFSGCEAKYRGGAVEIRSTNNTNSEGYERWTRMNNISFSGCTFTNCSTTNSHGGAIAVKAQLNSLSVSGSSFSGCTAGINGGAISIDGQDLPDKFGDTGTSNPNWAAALSCNTCIQDYSTIGTTLGGSYNWGNKITSTKTIEKKSKVGTVTISSDCSFKDCSCESNGGTIEFAEGCYIQNSATISGTTIDGGKAVGGGSAIFMSNCFVKKLNLHDDIFQNCDFASGGNDVGGTVRTTGNTTVVLDVQRCQFLNNHSYGHAGGLYWNAARAMEGVTCEATVNDCLFDGNSADMYGGALYVESKMTITKCHIKNNSAKIMGGGIAQQVYNNPNVRMLDAGGVTELKLDPTTWIHHNTAGVGGGISIRANETDSIKDGYPIAYTVRFELNGAAVYQNTATEHGGGIYFIAETSKDQAKQAEVDAYTKVILINAGTGTEAAVYNNTAAGNGGGIYMESSENTELRVQGGHISTNIAGGNGGGIYMTGKNATCYVEGGTIGGEGNDSAGNSLANKAVRAEGATEGGNGGGIAISGGAKIEMTGGTISYNTSSHDGGGIWLDKRKNEDEEGNAIANPVGNSITIEDGNIIYNQAGGSGGGVSMKYRSVANMTGGSVSYNTAQNNGGGLEIYHYADLTLSGGTIEGNTATTGSGGGIAAYYYGTSEIKGNSIIKQNKAQNSAGGGVFTHMYNITISGGEITGNSAKNGGGVCSSSTSENNYLTTVAGGQIYKNTATNWGGGIYAQGAKVNVTSGDIYQNEGPNSGGGIYAETGSTISVSGGKIYKNTAKAGWGAGIYAKDSGTKVTVSGGSIYENSTETGNGGAINVENNAELEISGGDIYKNNAGGYGGGIHSYNNSTITMKGGSIYNNTAGLAGGGISLRSGSTALVTKNTETSTVGKITNNTAARGGGVSVESGAELTVTGGYITYNKAVGACAQTSAIGHNTSLKGTGGGIYIADGNSDEDPAKFTLTGGEIAIYGNLADYAADDVFANGDNTLLDVPQKAEMNLAGYEFDPEGWFEDYPKNDSAYESGLSLAAPESGITNGNVRRYRQAGPKDRVLISDDIVDSMVNVADKYVCMTLGIPAAVSDTVVIDFGLPVDIRVLVNEQMTIANACLTGIGAAREETEGVDFSADEQLKAATLDLTSGKVEITNDGSENPELGTIRYTPNSTQMKDTDRFAYAVKYTNSSDGKYFYYYANVTVIPATTIYYEDSFVSYSVWNVSDDSLNTVADNQWADTPNGGTGAQEEDRPGEVWADGLDANNIYGYDGAYTSMTEHSMGSAKKVTVNKDLYAEAQFTFWGTGFDVVSMTSGSTGTILVDVFLADEFAEKGFEASRVENHLVDTYYGYKYEGGAWVVDPESTDALYQVPVVKVDGLGYNKYTVVITASYRPAKDHQKNGSYEFYLDAIRIYDPANDGTNDKTIQNAYVADGEGWPEYFELRDLIISKANFDSLGDDTISGIVFIDNTADTGENKVNSIADYTNYGPNNELYLAPGQAVAFDLAVPGDVAGVHLGMKSVGGTAYVNVYDAADTNKNSVTPTTIGTATDLYYDITGLNNKTVVIHNTGTDSAILSVTNVKVTYKTAHTDSIEDSYFTTTTDHTEAAVLSMRAVPGENEETVPEPTVPEETVPETTEPEETVPETTEPEETTPETPEPEETTPETPEPEETTPETPEPEETVPETTEPEEDEPETFVPEKFRVDLSGRSVKVGSRVVVTVTTSSDVDYISVNGVIITDCITNRRTGTRTWRVRITAEEAGELAVNVTAYNERGISGGTLTRTVKVTRAHTGMGSWLEDLLIGFFDGLWGSRR